MPVFFVCEFVEGGKERKWKQRLKFKEKRKGRQLKTSGITLIALVVTIVVLIILATISVQLIINGGLIGTAEQGKEYHEQEKAREKLVLILAEYPVQEAIRQVELMDFLTEKQQTGEIEEVTDNQDGTITVIVDGYEFTIDAETLEIIDAGKAGLRPQVSDIKITIDGTTEAEDGTVEEGTPLQITFNHSIAGGTTTVSPELPYTTDGKETKVTFVVTGTVDGQTYTKKVVVDVSKKYTDSTKDWNLDKVDKVTSEDGVKVPVPKGYTASTVAGEKRVDSGFVIKEGDNGGAKEGINEFVWVPVPKIRDIYDEANKAGQLWDFGNKTAGFKNPATKLEYTTTSGDKDHEPDVVTYAPEGQDSASGSSYDADPNNLKQAGFDTENMENDLNSDGTVNAYDFKIQLQNEFNSMIESVRIYKGFYIGRYETGNLSKTEAVVQKNNSDIHSQTWYTMYKLSKTIGANENVTGSMIWGCQWDATMRWMQASENENVKNFPTNSERRGNYYPVGVGGKIKVIPTGSNTIYEVNNIYDMAGNVWDWTLESIYGNARGRRGGSCSSIVSERPASIRESYSPFFSDNQCGSRATLYLTP